MRVFVFCVFWTISGWFFVFFSWNNLGFTIIGFNYYLELYRIFDRCALQLFEQKIVVIDLRVSGSITFLLPEFHGLDVELWNSFRCFHSNAHSSHISFFACQQTRREKKNKSSDSQIRKLLFLLKSPRITQWKIEYYPTIRRMSTAKKKKWCEIVEFHVVLNVALVGNSISAQNCRQKR